MAIKDQIRFPKTPATGAEAGNKSIVDSNLQVEDVLYIPVGETDTLNGGKDRDGAIRLTLGKLSSYFGGVWHKLINMPSGGTDGQVLAKTGSDVEWVDFPEPEELTFSNGITETDGNVKLGGAITENTFIGNFIDGQPSISIITNPIPEAGLYKAVGMSFGNFLQNKVVGIGVTDDKLVSGEYIAQFGFGFNDVVSGVPVTASIQANTDPLKPTLAISNLADGAGIQYYQEQVNLVNRSLVDKGYVDNKTDSASATAVQKSGDTMTGDLILSSPTPPNALSASPKVYVDNAIAGLKFNLDVLVASTANVNVASAPSSLDGVTLTNGDRLLLKNQTNASQNGIYIFNGTGNALTRSLDADTGVELANKTIPVNSGTVNADKWFTITNDSITLGTTNIVITQTAGAGTYSAGSNIAIAGNVVGVVNNPTFSGTVTAPTFAGNATKWGNLTNSGANNNDANTTILTFNNATNNAGYTTNSQIKGLLGINDGSSLNNVVSLSIASGGVNVNSGNNVSIGKDLASSGPLYFNYGGLPGGVTISDYVFQDGQGATKANIRSKTTITNGFTVATLPTGVIGMRAYVTDALAPTYLGVVVGGGAVTCPVFFNGTNWIT